MPIRVLLVEDSPVAVVILKRLLTSDPEIEVVGTAKDGREGLQLVQRLNPSVICTDLHMAGMDGLEFTRQVMATCPRPILVISTSVQTDDTHNIFQFLQAGALDIFPKPDTGLASDYEAVRQDLITKIKVLAGVKVFTQHRRESLATPVPPKPTPTITTGGTMRVIAVGASTGGPQTLNTILGQFPANFPVPILIVQHISEGFLDGLVSWLNSECRLKMAIAQPGGTPSGSTVYFAPERNHLELDAQGRFVYAPTPAVSGHRPSATVLFNAVARYYGRAAVGVLLTGMGRDGADGMVAIAQAGGMTLVQDERSCVVFGMPKEAIALGAVQHILPPNDIANFLLSRVLWR